MSNETVGGRVPSAKDLDRGAGGDRRRNPLGPDAGQECRPGRDMAERPGHPAGRGADRARRQQRIAEAVNALRAGARLSVHHRRHRPDPRRHHRRRDSRGVRGAGRHPSGGPQDPRGLLSRPAGRAERGAAEDGARAPRRRADPQPELGRAGREDRQRLHPRRCPAHRREHARGADRQARGRAADGLGDGGRTRGRKRGRRPAARDRSAHIPAWRSAAIRFSRTAATAPISSFARRMPSWRGAAATRWPQGLREAGYDPVEGGI